METNGGSCKELLGQEGVNEFFVLVERNKVSNIDGSLNVSHNNTCGKVAKKYSHLILVTTSWCFFLP